MHKKITLATVAALLCGPCFAEDWTPFDGAAIAAALTGRALVYEDGARQSFRHGGGITYSLGAGLSEGRWRVERDTYCSNWPPSGTWSCYGLDFDTASGQLRFVGPGGGVTAGAYDD
ncbi:MAG: hypothetical protein WBO29_04315 [Albidovulum sp.]